MERTLGPADHTGFSPEIIKVPLVLKFEKFEEFVKECTVKSKFFIIYIVITKK